MLVESLERHFSNRAHLIGDPAGMNLMVRFDDSSIAERAAANKVELVNTAPYYFAKAPRGEYLLGFSQLGERTIREGIKRLAS